MVSRSNLLSPIDLNNRGVCLLKAGKGEDAVQLFQKACKMAASITSHQQTRTRNMDHKREQLPSSLSKSSHSLHDNVHETTNEPSYQQSSRKQNTGGISFLADPTHNLGRPLWISCKEKRTAFPDSFPLFATLLYNFGLSVNLIAASKPNKEAAIPIYNKALALYEMACKIMMSGPLSNATSSPVYLVALHNMALVYAVLEDREQETIYRDRLVDFLFLMGAKRAIRESRFEVFYITHLSLSRTNTTATTA
jgi:tetratricopeptide (TPR) repeat protein